MRISVIVAFSKRNGGAETLAKLEVTVDFAGVIEGRGSIHSSHTGNFITVISHGVHAPSVWACAEILLTHQNVTQVNKSISDSDMYVYENVKRLRILRS